MFRMVTTRWQLRCLHLLGRRHGVSGFWPGRLPRKIVKNLLNGGSGKSGFMNVTWQMGATVDIMAAGDRARVPRFARVWASTAGFSGSRRRHGTLELPCWAAEAFPNGASCQF